MTQPSLLDLLLAEPGLAVCGLLVLVFTLFCLRGLFREADRSRRETDAWWASRQQFQPHDPSSLSDDSPEQK